MARMSGPAGLPGYLLFTDDGQRGDVANCIGAPRGAGLSPLRSPQRPALVVAPAPADLEIARRIAFPLKPARTHQRDGGDVVRLDIGLQPVQLECGEGMAC